jgi:hypothetical protein
MATRKKNPTLTADYERDTAKGKRRYRIGESGDAVVGTIYVDPSDPRSESDTLEVEVKVPVEAE